MRKAPSFYRMSGGVTTLLAEIAQNRDPSVPVLDRRCELIPLTRSASTSMWEADLPYRRVYSHSWTNLHRVLSDVLDDEARKSYQTRSAHSASSAAIQPMTAFRHRIR